MVAMTSVSEEEKIRRIEYVCAKCEAKDTMKLWPNEQVPVALNCWNCHAGQGIDMAQMIQQHLGMFMENPVPAVMH